MAGLTAEYAARGKLRNLSPEQERSLKLKVLEAQACFVFPLWRTLSVGPFMNMLMRSVMSGHAEQRVYVLCCATPCCTLLCSAVLCCAVLCCAVLPSCR